VRAGRGRGSWLAWGRPIGCELAQALAQASAPAFTLGCNGGSACSGASDAEGVCPGAWLPSKADGGAVCSATPSLQALRNGEALVKSGGRESSGSGLTRLASAPSAAQGAAWIRLRPRRSSASPPAARSELTPTCRRSTPNIYAAGDCAGPYQFTHTAAHQAWYAAVKRPVRRNLRRSRWDNRVIPRTTFLRSRGGQRGLTEQEAAAASSGRWRSPAFRSPKLPIGPIIEGWHCGSAQRRPL